MNMPELINYVQAPKYAGSKPTEQRRQQMRRELISTCNATKTFQLTSTKINSHSWPYKKAYLEQLETGDSAKRYVSIEEKTKKDNQELTRETVQKAAKYKEKISKSQKTNPKTQGRN